MATIHILEGPAGSGKSYIREYLAEEGVLTVQSSLPTRNPERGVACQLSLANDLNKLVEALFILAGDESLVVIDRCYLSQWVYRQCRLNSETDEQLAPVSPKLLLTAFGSLLYDLSKEVVLRSETMAQVTFFIPKVHFWIILPEVNVIRNRRRFGLLEDGGGPGMEGTKYLWPAALVRSLYQAFEGVEIPGTVEVTLIEGEEQEKWLVAALLAAQAGASHV